MSCLPLLIKSATFCAKGGDSIGSYARIGFYLYCDVVALSLFAFSGVPSTGVYAADVKGVSLGLTAILK